MTETHRLIDLANIISKLTNAEINYLPNPRNESEENDLIVDNQCFINLGLKPTKLTDALLEEIKEIANKFIESNIKKGWEIRSQS